MATNRKSTYEVLARKIKALNAQIAEVDAYAKLNGLQFDKNSLEFPGDESDSVPSGYEESSEYEESWEDSSCS